MKLHSLLLLLVVWSGPALAAPLDDKIQAFNEALRTSLPAGQMPFGRMAPSLSDASNYPGGEAGLESMVQQAMAASRSHAVQKAGADLLALIQDDRKARLAEVTAKIDAVLVHAADVVSKAQKPADLDTLLGEIQAVTPSGFPSGDMTDEQTEMNRINAAYQFVAQWQDYLSQSAAGNKQEALSTLRNLAQQRVVGTPIVERSVLLDRIAALEPQVNTNSGVPPALRPEAPPFGPLLEGVKTLDDLAAAAQKAQEMATGTYGGLNNYDALRLQQMAMRYAEAKNGLPVSLNLRPANYSFQPGSADFVRLEVMLYAYLLPLYFGPDAPPENAGETVAAYLDRVTAAALAARNESLLQHTISARLEIADVQPQMTQEIQPFFAALNQDMAGQYAQAVTSYENALRAASQFVPVAFVGQRLAELKKEHPAEYDEGLKNSPGGLVPLYLPPPHATATQFPIPSYPVLRPSRPGLPPSVPASPAAPVPGTPSSPMISPSPVPAPAAPAGKPNPD